MDSIFTKDARGFVDGVVTMLQSENISKSMAPKVQSLLGKMTQQLKHDRAAVAQTSVPLSAEEKKSLEAALALVLDRPVTVDVRVVPRLIGGLRIKVGDWVLDTSLAGQLHQLSKNLVEETYEK